MYCPQQGQVGGEYRSPAAPAPADSADINTSVTASVDQVARRPPLSAPTQTRASAVGPVTPSAESLVRRALQTHIGGIRLMAAMVAARRASTAGRLAILALRRAVPGPGRQPGSSCCSHPRPHWQPPPPPPSADAPLSAATGRVSDATQRTRTNGRTSQGASMHQGVTLAEGDSSERSESLTIHSPFMSMGRPLPFTMDNVTGVIFEIVPE